MNVKKVFEEVNSLLLSNKDKKIEDVYPQLLSLMSTKNDVQSTNWTHNGEVIAIYCYYHKMWEIVHMHDYGNKKNSTTGLNSMCKLGVNQWTKQQRIAKNELLAITDKVVKGEVKPEGIEELRNSIEANRNLVEIPKGYPTAFKTLEECKEYVNKHYPMLITGEALFDFTQVEEPKKTKKTKKEV